MRKKKRLQIPNKRNIAISIVVVLVVVSFFGIFGTSITGLLIFNDRPQYCANGDCINSAVFKEMPALPDDFDEVKVMIDYNQYPVLENFTDGVPDYNYYIQPEFYPNWANQGVSIYAAVQEGRLAGHQGIYGYGAFPSDLLISPSKGAVVSPGTDLVAVTFFHAGWGITKYQGMKLDVIYPQAGKIGKGLGELVVNQDPSVVRNYFNVEIDPNVILLDSNFPIFFDGWAQKVKIKVHINENTPSGNYLIGIRPSRAPEEERYQWSRDYRLMYVDIGGIATERPPYRMFIEVQ